MNNKNKGEMQIEMEVFKQSSVDQKKTADEEEI